MTVLIILLRNTYLLKIITSKTDGSSQAFNRKIQYIINQLKCWVNVSEMRHFWLKNIFKNNLNLILYNWTKNEYGYIIWNTVYSFSEIISQMLICYAVIDSVQSTQMTVYSFQESTKKMYLWHSENIFFLWGLQIEMGYQGHGILF